MASTLRMEGLLVGKPSDLQFDPNFPYTYCRLCGEVFQRPADRDLSASLIDLMDNTEIRRNWSVKHSRTHTDTEHRQLKLSGLWATPEAAFKLDSFGIKLIGAGVVDDETRDALSKADRVPRNDAEGS